MELDEVDPPPPPRPEAREGLFGRRDPEVAQEGIPRAGRDEPDLGRPLRAPRGVKPVDDLVGRPVAPEAQHAREAFRRRPAADLDGMAGIFGQADVEAWKIGEEPGLEPAEARQAAAAARDRIDDEERFPGGVHWPLIAWRHANFNRAT